MKFISKTELLEKSNLTLSQMYNMFYSKESMSLEDVDPNKTVIVIVDMINGFAREGLLQSPRVNDLVPNMVELLKLAKGRNIPLLAFADAHDENNPEFQSYPEHCLKGSSESEIIKEIQEIGGYTLIEKNSTNGFLEKEFQEWLRNNPNIENFIVIGDCTDICVQHFSITLKNYFDKENKVVDIIIPIEHVDTFDLEVHNADLMNIMSLFMMQNAGIKIVKDIQ